MAIPPRIILDSKKFRLTLDRLCYQLIENHGDFRESCLIGVQPRGVLFSDRIFKVLQEKIPDLRLSYGKMDVTFYRDDFRRRDKTLTPADTTIDFTIEDKRVIIADDVLFTGRTIRAAMDALVDFGRPLQVELLVLVDRRFSRHLPIQPDYTGQTVDSIASEVVKVEWKEVNGHDRIWIMSEKEKTK